MLVESERIVSGHGVSRLLGIDAAAPSITTTMAAIVILALALILGVRVPLFRLADRAPE
jgi:hypothetical protein